ncbi:rhodanese-like domain-containing protein [Actinoplanes sp. NPDC051851]|uniref:rhodanese-like domain-containing protein n=1 Tax=Actinoplanes sp. NPDC051851 TaxID=3154753 RepID=UPI00341F7A9C
MTKKPATIDATDLHHLITNGQAPRMIDVRTPAEFAAVHILGSVNMPLGALRLDPDDRVVLVCRSGQRATRAAAGLPHSRVLTGGILAWQALGAPVTTGAPRWDLDRQVRLVAGGLVVTAVLASTVVEPAKWLAALVGGGLAVAALTGTCALGTLLAALPYNRR